MMCLYSQQSKLYHLRKGEWTERGVGYAKLMQHPHTGKVRLIMRQEKTRMVVADHDVIDLQPNANSTKSLVWTAQDMSNNELCNELFALKFKGPELASMFAQEFNRAKDLSLGRPNVRGGYDDTAAVALSAAAAAAEADPMQVAMSARPRAPGITAGTSRCEAPCCDAAVLSRNREAAVACTATAASERTSLPDGVGGVFATTNSRSIHDRMLERLWQGIRDCQQRTMQVEERAQKADERARRAEEELDKMRMHQQQQQQKESELQQLVQRLLQQHSDNMLVGSLQSDLDHERQQQCSLEAKVPLVSVAVLLCCGVCFLAKRGVGFSMPNLSFFHLTARRVQS